MTLTIEQLNDADDARFVALLDGLYEHTSWVTERAAAHRPFASATELLQVLGRCVAEASDAEQLALIRAHPELGVAKGAAGAPPGQPGAGVAGAPQGQPGASAAGEPLTTASAHEQRLAGLLSDNLSNAVREGLRQENAAYRARFGFPFILAVRGADGTGMAPEAILATLRRRLLHAETEERAEALRQINRIAELRLQRLLEGDTSHRKPAPGATGVAEQNASGKLTTHVLDTAVGRPAAGMRLTLTRFAADGSEELLGEYTTNTDGRCDRPLLEGAACVAGCYELRFAAGDYFRSQDHAAALAEPRFVDIVVLKFGLADPVGHYHVPLLVSPWSYSTYRGS